MEEIEFSRWLFESRLRQGKNKLPDGLNQLCYFAGSSKSHRENSISCIFLESPHQVDMKNVVNCWKDFLQYFATLKTYRVAQAFGAKARILPTRHFGRGCGVFFGKYESVRRPNGPNAPNSSGGHGKVFGQIIPQNFTKHIKDLCDKRFFQEARLI